MTSTAAARRARRLATAAALLAIVLPGALPAQSAHPASHASPTTPSGAGAASDLRVGLNALLREHVHLAAAATGAALGGRTAEFEAAAAALDRNSVAVAKAIGSVYGAGAEQAFLPLWRKHIGFFVAYTQGAAAKDRAKQDRAVADLVAYTQDFGAFLQSANPRLPKATVAELVKGHALSLKAVVDAQAAMDPAAAYAALQEAAAHMQMIADPLAAAIAAQFPERYR